jgi:hypothetical protein
MCKTLLNPSQPSTTLPKCHPESPCGTSSIKNGLLDVSELYVFIAQSVSLCVMQTLVAVEWGYGNELALVWANFE